MYLSICLCIYVFLAVDTHLPTYLLIYQPPIDLSIYLSILISVNHCLSLSIIHLSFFPSTYLAIYVRPSIFLSVLSKAN